MTKIFVLLVTFYSSFSYATLEQVIYKDTDGNVLSSRIRSSTEVSANGFEQECNEYISASACFGYGGGGFRAVQDCKEIPGDKLSVIEAEPGAEPEEHYRFTTVYVCENGKVKEEIFIEKSCILLPGDLYRPALNMHQDHLLFNCN